MQDNIPVSISLLVKNIGSIDILQFAALAMSTLGLFAKWHLKPQFILVYIVLIQVINSLLVQV